VLDPRLYRAAFVPALLALLVVAFSVRDRPRPLRTSLAADAFSQPGAERTLRHLAARFPDRRPGSADDRALARHVATALRAAGFQVTRRRFSAQTIDGDRRLETVAGTRAGFERRRLVVVAHRDAAASPATAELSATAALLELARVFEGRKLRKTLVLASTSGGSGGAAGLRDLIERTASRTEAVLVLGDLAGRRLHRPWVVPWSNGAAPAPPRLVRTVEDAVREEVGQAPGGAGVWTQLARLAFPLTLGEQGAAGAAGVPAVLLQASGERGPEGASAVDGRRLRDFGRAALRSVTALDEGPERVGPPEPVLVLRGKVVPGWAVRLLVGALLAPVVLATLDAFARARRRREPVAMWLGWVLAGAVPFALALAFAALLAAVGLIAAAPAPPVSGAALPVGGAAAAALVASALAFLLGWIGVRPVILRALGVRGQLVRPGAAAALALVGGAAVVVVWVSNPYAAVILLPAAHLWVLVALADVRPPPWARWAALAGGLLAPALVAVHYVRAFDLGPLDALWNALLLPAGGRMGVGGALLWSVLLGCLASLVAVLRARPPEVTDRRLTLRGPRSYAGPGSLGGTSSALRR
jgi:hypothetical protein